MKQSETRIDPVTIVGLGLVLLPLLTMWHEVGGHAAACATLGGRVTTIGAFYVDCNGVDAFGRVLVSCAGVAVDTVLALLAWAAWRHANRDLVRLTLFYVMVSKAFVAAGYFLFSGLSGIGDLGTAAGGGLHDLPQPLAWRTGFFVFGLIVYIGLVRGGIRALAAMLGDAAADNPSRRRIAHLFYVTIGVDAVLVGLLNPVGLFITILSAAASSFGGNAGFISIGYAGGRGPTSRPFQIVRSWPVLIAGIAVSAAFAAVLGPSIRP